MDDKLIAAVEQLNEDEVFKLVEQRLKAGKKPVYLREQIRLGMVKVGILYEKGEYFIADLIMAGEIVKNVLKLILTKPENQHHKKMGTILLGTVQGDLHDIGKNIFSSMIEAEGFEVVDLGIDVPPGRVCSKDKGNPSTDHSNERGADTGSGKHEKNRQRLNCRGVTRSDKNFNRRQPGKQDFLRIYRGRCIHQ
jgi:hypothetical protein